MLQDVTNRSYTADEAIEIFEASIAYFTPAEAEADIVEIVSEDVVEYYSAA